MVGASEIKQILDHELKPEELGANFKNINTNAIKLFQKLFVEFLHFDLIEGQFGEVAEELPVEEWNKTAEVENAYLIAEKDNFRIIHVVINKLTRYRERSAISSLRKEKWAIKGEYICIFYSKNSDIWHMICPHYTEGRTILRRYIIGKGENHRTISENLTLMDASLSEPLFERVQDAFKVQVVTENFYERYKQIFKNVINHIYEQGIEISKAKKFTHLLLNRLMFIYFIQKKSWINEDKYFMLNYLEQYKSSGDKDLFYQKWLHKLFFEAMSNPISKKSISDFNNEVNNLLNNIPYLNGGLFELYDVDKLKIQLPDVLLFNILLDFLEEYNFTITEESPFDLDIAIDPAMLGKIYESLIAEEERGKSGIFYTPRIEVDLMCRLGLFKYFLNENLPLQKNIEKILIEFIFTPVEDWDINKGYKYDFIRKSLNSVKIVDPACGSGAFLIGMLEVLIELYLKLGVKIDFNLKEDIIYNSLYGVDIKDWAVRMAEFRLWLGLIESEEKKPNKNPILPNFSFKLQCGDSIVQKVGKEHINFKDHRKKVSKSLQKNLEEIVELKKQFFDGKKNLSKKINDQQIEILINILIEENDNYKLEIKQNTQTTLTGGVTEKSREIIREINKKIKENENLLKKLQDRNIKNIFLWDLSFPEIMLYGGFDIVIANPPYIEFEKIINPAIETEDLKGLTKNEIKKLKDEYKNDLIDYVQETFNLKLAKTCDYYVYFYYKALELLNDNGIIIFITSNSWLDAKFGKYLQEGLLKYSYIDYIIDNRTEKTFEEADINTVISILIKKRLTSVLLGEVKFIAINEPFEKIINNKDIIELLSMEENKEYLKLNFYEQEIHLKNYNKFRKIKVLEKNLWKLAGGKIESFQLNLKTSTKQEFKATGKYGDLKLGKFLIAPEVYFKILYEKGDIFTPLSDKTIIPEKRISNVRYGLKTGKNEFFLVAKPGSTNGFFRTEMNKKTGALKLYLSNKKYKKYFKKYFQSESEPLFILEKEYWMNKIDLKIDELKKEFEIVFNDENNHLWVPNYYIKSPKEISNITITPKNSNLVILLINGPKSSLKKGIQNYIEWGEAMAYQNGATCSKRKPWYDLKKNEETEILCMKLINDRYIFTYNKYKLDYDPNIYGIKFNKFEELYLILLNSSLFPLFLELEGRTNLGGGALPLMVFEYENILIFKHKFINSLSLDNKKELLNILNNPELLNLQSIFKDFNTRQPNRIEINNITIGRKTVDKIVFEEILNLDEEQILDIYRSILILINNRLKKAKSK